MTDAVSLLKQNMRLSTLVGRYTEIKQRGRRQVGRCPFHGEKTPSFYVDDDKGLFYCFGCKKGGDLLRFAQDIENLEFTEALDFLAELAGIELPKMGHRGPGRDVIEQLRAINQSASDFYARQLRLHESARAYAAERGLSDATLKLFAMGYSPSSWDSLHQELRSKYEPSLLEKSGLFRSGRSGNTFDQFRDRLMFPIRDAFGHIVAFGGRLLEGEGPKYVNSPETPLYTKGHHVYNLHHAKAFLKKEPFVLVVEGYLDVIQLCQAGFNHVVASLGTAFTPEQAKLLHRYCDQAVLNFDGDEAGFKAARASIERLLAVGLDVRVVSLSAGDDPDSFVRDHGIEAYRTVLDGAEHFYDFLLRYLGRDQAESDPHARSALVAEMMHTFNEIQDAVVREHYKRRLCDDVSVTIDVLETVVRPSRLSPQSAIRDTAGAKPGAVKTVSLSKTEAEFIFQVFHGGEAYDSFLREHPQLKDLLAHVFARFPTLVDLFDQLQETDLEDLIASQPLGLRESLREIYFSEYFTPSPERLDSLLPDLMRTMLRAAIEQNNRLLRALDSLDHEGKRRLMQQNLELNRQFHQL